jgi:ribosomal protein S18 acetylase RimI-like enzyme
MLEKIEEIASSRGIKKLTLDTAKMRADLIKLYERHGFRVFNECQPKHGKDNHVRVFMEKSLE